MADTDKNAAAADDSDIEPLVPKLRHVGHLDAHHRFFVALGVASLTLLIVSLCHFAHWPTRLLITWNAYSLTLIVLIWITIISADPSEVARTASLQDTGRRTLFIFAVGAAIVSVFAVAFELGTVKGLDKTHAIGHVVFAVLTIVSSWTLVHSVFTLRYAHTYYGLMGSDEAKCSLNFPDEDSPDYLDFAYFSFVIGMTSQVSDVTISSREMRRLALVHGLIAFGFNVAILGLCMNVVSGLLQ